MTRVFFVVSGLFLGLAVVVWVAVQTLFGNGPVAWLVGEDLSHLQQSKLVDLVELTDADHVVYRNGRTGWFLVKHPDDLRNGSIGFFGPRMVEKLFSASHQPIYCGSDTSKILWVIRNGRVDDALAFCKSNRMDLSSLRTVSQPVEMETHELSKDEVEALLPDVDADPNAYWVTRPDNITEFTHQQIITLPYIWSSTTEDTPNKNDLEQALHKALLAQTNASPDELSVSLALQIAPRLGGLVSASDQVQTPTHLIRVDDDVLQLSHEVSLMRPILTLRCAKDLCLKMSATNLSALLQPHRKLEGVHGTRHPIATLSNENIDFLPNMAEIRDQSQKPGALSQVTYLTRYVRTH